MNINIISQELLEELRAMPSNTDSCKYEKKVNVLKYYPKIEPGSYVAITRDVDYEEKVRSMYGINDKLVLTYSIYKEKQEGTYEAVDLKQTYWKSSSQQSSFYKYLKEILGRDPREGFELKELLGVTCSVEISHNETEKGTFANIEDIKIISDEVDYNHVVI